MFGEESNVCMAVFKIASGSRVCGSAAVPRETVWPAEIGRISQKNSPPGSTQTGGRDPSPTAGTED